MSVRKEAIEPIVAQYRSVVGELDGIFKAASPRTEREWWPSDGVGSCALIKDKKHSEVGLTGLAKSRIIELRDARNLEVGGTSTQCACPYHRAGSGCVLGDLKSPVCIVFVENRAELTGRFGIHIDNVTSRIKAVLNQILSGETAHNPAPVSTFIDEVKGITDRIEQEPILHDGSFRDKRRVFWKRLKIFHYLSNHLYYGRRTFVTNTEYFQVG